MQLSDYTPDDVKRGVEDAYQDIVLGKYTVDNPIAYILGGQGGAGQKRRGSAHITLCTTVYTRMLSFRFWNLQENNKQQVCLRTHFLFKEVKNEIQRFKILPVLWER